MNEYFVQTPHGRFHVEESGGGAPWLFLHGGTASTREWRPVLPQLGAHGRCVAVDRLGCGLSDRSAAGYGREHVTASLLACADALGFERFGVVGQSFGGFWALSMALAAPERVRGLVLVNAAAAPLTDQERAAMEERRRAWASAPPVFDDEQIERLIGLIFHDPQRVPASFRADARWQMEQAEGGQLDALGTPIERDDFGRVAAPTLVVWGEQDSAFPPELGRRLADAMPGASYAGLPGCGHTCQIECPDAFVAAVGPFLGRGV
jgi:pimeloyl-ACP methyl ester carboxylesterase